MGTKSSHISVIIIISAIVIFTFGAGTVRAEVASVDLGLSPPAAPTNVLTSTLTWQSGMGHFFYQDTDCTTLSGNIMANLTAQYDSITHQVSDIDGIEFVGDKILFSDMSFLLSPNPMKIYTLTGVSGYLDTPAPPGAVSGGQLSMSDHVLILNDGVCTSHEGGISDTVLDLSANPVTIALNGTGSIAASLDSVFGDQAVYNVVLTAPIDYDALLINRYLSSTFLNLEGSGALEAEGQFLRTIPEPATGALLVLGFAALVQRRRG